MVATNFASGVISNSAADIPYELQYTPDLLQPWQSAGWFVYGSELTNWTPFIVPAISSSNLFLRVRSWQDDGSGLPIWWQMQYFGTNSVDPYGDPKGDGWNNLQKFQNGMNPNVFYTPAAPQNLTMQVNNNSLQATFSWQANSGNVSQYEIDEYGSPIGYTPASQTTFSTGLGQAYYGTDLPPPTFTVKALYSNGSASAEASASQELSQFANPVQIIQNIQGQYELIAANLPPGAVTIHLFWVTNYYLPSEESSYYDVPVSNLVNGIYMLPNGVMETNSSPYYGGTPLVEILHQSGQYDWEAFAEEGASSAPYWLNGSARVLKDNLIFLLRAATVDSPFDYTGVDLNFGDIFHFSNPATYAYAGFYPLDEDASDPWYYENVGSFDPNWPFESNYRYRNFVFNSTNLTSYGYPATDVGGSYTGMTPPGYNAYNSTVYGLYQEFPMFFAFQPPANGATVPSLLATNNTRWLASYALDSSSSYLWKIGVTNYEGENGMFNNVRNWYGLTFLSVNIANSDGITMLSAGNITSADGYFYPETAQPQFQLAEYDFWDRSPVPGSSGFSTTNTSDLLIAPVGSSIMVNGYAKLAVLNGYSGVYGYLGQYFDAAYQITNGIVTTNSTGILSPYGNFFATEPGPVALVTMPDLDTGGRGTGVVYCVSMNVDKNHDGVMDLAFNGIDATSQSSPMVFWCNNNFDRWNYDWLSSAEEQDDVLPGGSDGLNYDPNNPDCNYKINGYRAIPDSRDLEDFARLWICGVTSNLLVALPAGSTVTLSWADQWDGQEYRKLVTRRLICFKPWMPTAASAI